MSVSLQGVGYKCEWHSKHSCASGANHQERNELHILVVQERNHAEANRTDSQT